MILANATVNVITPDMILNADRADRMQTGCR